MNPPLSSEALDARLRRRRRSLGADAVVVADDVISPSTRACPDRADPPGRLQWKRRNHAVAIKYRS
jgi:hypothetical protein